MPWICGTLHRGLIHCMMLMIGDQSTAETGKWNMLARVAGKGSSFFIFLAKSVNHASLHVFSVQGEIMVLMKWWIKGGHQHLLQWCWIWGKILQWPFRLIYCFKWWIVKANCNWDDSVVGFWSKLLWNVGSSCGFGVKAQLLDSDESDPITSTAASHWSLIMYHKCILPHYRACTRACAKLMFNSPIDPSLGSLFV